MDFLRECAEFDEARISRYALAQRYYDGKHKTQLLSRAKVILEANGIPYAENYCDLVVDSFAHRLTVRGFTTGAENLDDWARSLWEVNRADELQGIVHTNAPMKGDGVVVVDFSEKTGRARFSWNRPELWEFHYSDDGDLELGVKCWETRASSKTNPNGKPIRRMNLHYANRIEKYFAVAQGANANWSPHVDHADIAENGDTTWPIWWTDNGHEDGEPIGINAIHFRHKAKGDTYGRSKVTPAVPMQDGINKACVDLFYVMDALGFPVRTATGVPEDVTLSVAVGEWVKATSESAKFDTLPSEDPDKMVKSIEASIRRFALKNRTPVHALIGGTLPSGESLKTANEASVQDAEDAQTYFGNSWEDVITLGHAIETVFGENAPELGEARFQTQWEDAETRNDLEEAQILEIEVREFGLSKATALAKRGYDAADELEKSQQESADLGEAILKGFDNGQVDTGIAAG